MTPQKPADRTPARSAERTRNRSRVMYVTAAVVVVIAVALAIVSARVHTGQAADQPATSASARVDSSGISSPQSNGLSQSRGPQIEAHGHDEHQAGSREYTPGAPAPAAAQALVTIGAFGTAWARPYLSADQWWQGVAPLCEPGFAARLKTADPGTVPVETITGAPTVVDSRTDLVTATLAAGGGTLTVTAALLGGQWLVTGNDYTRTPS